MDFGELEKVKSDFIADLDFEKWVIGVLDILTGNICSEMLKHMSGSLFSLTISAMELIHEHTAVDPFEYFGFGIRYDYFVKHPINLQKLDKSFSEALLKLINEESLGTENKEIEQKLMTEPSASDVADELMSKFSIFPMPVNLLAVEPYIERYYPDLLKNDIINTCIKVYYDPHGDKDNRSVAYDPYNEVNSKIALDVIRYITIHFAIWRNIKPEMVVQYVPFRD